MNLARSPVISSIHGVGPCCPANGPTYFLVGEFDVRSSSRVELRNDAFPGLASIRRSLQRSVGADFVAGACIQEEQIPCPLISRFLRSHQHRPGVSAILCFGNDARLAHGITHACTGELNTSKIALALLRQSLNFHLGAAGEDLFPVLAPIGRREKCRPVNAKSLRVGNEEQLPADVPSNVLPGFAVSRAK